MRAQSRQTAYAFTLALLCAAFLLPIQAATAQTSPTVQAGQSVPVMRWVRAVESGDEQAIARMTSERTVAYVPDAMVLRGRDAITAAYGAMFSKFAAKVSIDDAHFIEAGDLIHSWGLYTLTLTPRAGGAPIVMNGRFSDVAVRVGDGWQYIMDHASLPLKN
jgi:ketosteroid isomerase-like protein